MHVFLYFFKAFSQCACMYVHILNHFSFFPFTSNIDDLKKNYEIRSMATTLTENFHSAYANETSISTWSSVNKKPFHVRFQRKWNIGVLLFLYHFSYWIIFNNGVKQNMWLTNKIKFKRIYYKYELLS